jgi:hypothetical protein
LNSAAAFSVEIQMSPRNNEPMSTPPERFDIGSLGGVPLPINLQADLRQELP